ncbi:MAG: ABC transporter ATP-binding protein/permease [Coriobacteriales bacterium]|nr:ABC transporter ATP-binding protein/permease [Coriobacteriales bacterium]
MRKLSVISMGKPKRLIKPIVASVIADCCQMLPFGLAALAVSLIYGSFAEEAALLDTDRLWLICGGMLVALVLLFIAEIFSYRASYRGAYETSAEGRASFAEHLRKLPLGYLTRKDPEELSSMMMSDFTQLEGALAQVVGQLVGGILMPVLIFAGLMLLDWRMALAVFASLPMTGLLLLLVSSLKKRVSEDYVQSRVDMSNRFGEYVAGMKVIKSYRMQGANFKRLEQAISALMNNGIRVEAWLGSAYLMAVALTKSGLALIVIMGVYLISGGALSVPVFALFLLVGTRVFDPLTAALLRLSEWNRAVLSGERIMRVMEEPAMAGRQDAPDAYDITFEEVSFGYGDTPVLSDVSLSFEAGSLTAIVGPSGSGKSTLLKLIARFYDPESGSVRFGGVEGRDINPEKLLKNLSMVFQDVYLFEDTIGANIRYGRQGATQEEVEAAARAACCHDFISSLPKGYDTPVGEGGLTLSGGEKQRVSLARAILKDAPIVLLDEATASLDPENEAEVQRAIDALASGRTLVVVAHRLNTVTQADQIIVLDRGRVVEQGRHDELYVAGGLYAKLWNLQQETTGWVVSV